MVLISNHRWLIHQLYNFDLSSYPTINWSPFQWKGLGYEAPGQYTNQGSDWIHLILVSNFDFTGSSYPTINNFHFIKKILQKKFFKIVSLLLFFWIYKNYNPYWDFKGENACAGRHDHQKYACAGQHDHQKYACKSQYGFDKKNCCSYASSFWIHHRGEPILFGTKIRLKIQ